MAKRTTQYVCAECGHAEPKWLGRCPECGTWNSLEERAVHAPKGGSAATAPGRTSEVLATARPLSSIEAGSAARTGTGLGEFDRALGGGLVHGATVLIGGEPGIGKSTLMLQAAGHLAARNNAVLYVSGEESAGQIRRRADRLGIDGRAIHLLCSANLERIESELRRLKPAVVVVDSLQTIIAEEAGTIPGTVNQIKFATHAIGEWARDHNAAAMLVAHVTKEGQIAGPKVVEHMVDAVLFFEHSGAELRFLRAVKNRFGAIEEVGLFVMGADGLHELSDPARAFLHAGEEERPAGVVATPCFEGSRVLMVELQALTVTAKGTVSRTLSDRIDPRRVSRVAAVLEKQLGVRFSDQDIYVNVAGGFRVQDVGVDLPLALALYSARTGLAIDRGTVATGELTLAGEVRPVGHAVSRARAALDLGFSTVVGAARGHDREKLPERWVGVSTIVHGIRSVFGAGAS